MDLSVVITIVLAFSTCISPVLVALINNSHTRKMKSLELSATEALRKLELNNEAKWQVILSDHKVKYNAYLNFIQAASEYMFDNKNPLTYSKVLAAYSECVMNGITCSDMDGYMQYVKTPESALELDEHRLQQMSLLLGHIAQKFNDSLQNDLSYATTE